MKNLRVRQRRLQAYRASLPAGLSPELGDGSKDGYRRTHSPTRFGDPGVAFAAAQLRSDLKFW